MDVIGEGDSTHFFFGRYLALGEFLMFLGTLLSGTGQIEKFSRKYLERMVYVIRYMQDMDGRKKHHFCYE